MENNDDSNSIHELWRLCDELTVEQATLLIIGIDPSSETGAYCYGWRTHEQPQGYMAVSKAISAALRSGEIDGCNHEISAGDLFIATDIQQSTVIVASLVEWLKKRQVHRGFFFQFSTATPGYLDKNHPRYAPMLAAAIKAWEAVTDPNGRGTRQALEKWLRENAATFGMTDEQGNPVNQAIEDCSKVANWNKTGGAPKTPTKANPTTPKP